MRYSLPLAALLFVSAAHGDGPAPRPQLTLDVAPTALAFSPDGKALATAADDKTVRVWDAASGKPLLTLMGHAVAATALAFSPDGKLLASAGCQDARPGDFELMLWDAATGKVVREVREKGHRDEGDGAPPRPFVAFSPDGSMLAAPTKDRTVRVLDVKTWGEKHSWKMGLVPSAAAFSPDGKSLVLGTDTGETHGTAGVVNLETGERVGLWAWYSGTLQLAFSADGKHVLGGFRHRVFRRDLGVRKPNDESDEKLFDGFTKRPDGRSEIDALAFSPGGGRLAMRFGHGLEVIDTATKKPLLAVDGVEGPVAFAADGKRVAVGVKGGGAKVWGID
jgi:WD40 repeat protein